jgi:YHS domain-containing protein
MKRDLLIILGMALMFGVSIAYHLHAQALEEQRRARQQKQLANMPQAYDPLQEECPVCGEDARERDYSGEFEYEGENYIIYFDKEECKNKFLSNPDKYLQDYERIIDKQQGPATPAGTFSGRGGGGQGGPGGPGGPSGRGGGEGSGGQEVTPPGGAGQAEGGQSE